MSNMSRNPHQEKLTQLDIPTSLPSLGSTAQPLQVSYKEGTIVLCLLSIMMLIIDIEYYSLWEWSYSVDCMSRIILPVLTFSWTSFYNSVVVNLQRGHSVLNQQMPLGRPSQIFMIFFVWVGQILNRKNVKYQFCIPRSF